ncbi:MAG TPA: chemotaxis protein CheA [Gemmatimonadaceae bacterium]|nr:chemotaxis protein CheA [Gemmatimonadaceae bacterium]
MDTAKYVALFASESRENLAAINQALLALERRPEAGESVNELFRAVHTIKGMSGVMGPGYGGVAELAHELESLLSSVRDGTRLATADTIELLFASADALEQAIEQAVSGHDQESKDAVAPVLQRLRATNEWAAPVALLQNQKPVSADDLGGPGFLVTVRLAADAALPAVRAVMVLQRAASLGRLHASRPDKDMLAREWQGDTILLRLETTADSRAVEEALRDVGEIADVRVARSDGSGTEDMQARLRSDDAWGRARARSGQNASVRIDLRRLDALVNLVGELVIARGRLSQLSSEISHGDLDDAVGHAARLIGELQDAVMASRLVPVWQIFDRFPRVVRDAARALGKEVEFVVEGREIEVDRSLLDQLGDPLIHLLRNAVDHGIESPEARLAAGKPRIGRLVLRAARDRAAVMVTVTDDGRGLDRASILRKSRALGMPEGELGELTDEQLLRVISRPGFSTAQQVSDYSGRGVGMDVVLSRVRGLGGSMELHTSEGQGTSLTLHLPATLAIVPALLTRVASETYALPLTHVQETLHLTPDVVRAVRGRDVLVLRDEFLPLVRLRDVVQLPVRDAEGSQVVVIEVADRRAGVVVDQLIGQQEIVVKTFDTVRGAASCVTGATILSDGSPALILEATSLL